MSYVHDFPKYVAIAPGADPAPKYNYKNNPYTGAQAASIARRNARERNRVKQVNDGYNALRKRLPAAVINALSGGARRGTGKKLSKVDTLRMVVEYIRYLENLIEDSDTTIGITTPMDIEDEGVFAGRTSPYSDCAPSPVNSDCSSGISCSYKANKDYTMTYQNEYAMTDSGVLEEMWWSK